MVRIDRGSCSGLGDNKRIMLFSLSQLDEKQDQALKQKEASRAIYSINCDTAAALRSMCFNELSLQEPPSYILPRRVLPGCRSTVIRLLDISPLAGAT